MAKYERGIKKPNKNKISAQIRDRVAWSTSLKFDSLKVVSKKRSILERIPIKENIFIGEEFRKRKAIWNLNKIMPEYTFKIVPIIDSVGKVNFRRYWYTQKERVEELLTYWRYSLAFKEKGSRIWRRINYLNRANEEVIKGEKFMGYKEVVKLQYTRHKKRSIDSKKFGIYEYLEPEVISIDLNDELKAQRKRLISEI